MRAKPKARFADFATLALAKSDGCSNPNFEVRNNTQKVSNRPKRPSRPFEIRHSDLFRYSIFVLRILQGDLGALARAFDFQMTFAFSGQLSRRLHHLVDHLVVVRWIVMKKNELTNAGIQGQ